LSQEVWYSGGLAFSCTQCGNCCGGAPGHVWVSENEIRAIAQRLGMAFAEFEQRHTRLAERGRSLLEFENGDCEFLVRRGDGKTECSIHAVRPLQCRTWPFWQSNLRTRRTWDGAARNCPGMNTGTHHPLPVIQDALRRNTLAQLPL
jgi:Fe-S-cluster containining protein